MDNAEKLTKGLEILRRHDDTGGDVSVGRDGGIYAGPQDDGLAGITPGDARVLGDLGWEFDMDIGRWGWSH